MRWRRLCSWAINVATGPVILFGCAPHPVTFEPTTAAGSITGQPGRRGLVIAAPHGTSDTRTGDIAAELARRTGFGVVIATGFSLEPDTRERAGRRYQVNRPVEGLPGRPPSEEVATEEARRVYEAYERRVREVAQGPVRFLAEIHGNNHRDTAGRIEIATVGVDRDDAFRLRTLLELIRDAHLRAHRDAPRLDDRVEPADTHRYGATGAKKNGILRLPERALHIELPRAARADWRETYTAILAEFLVQAVALPAGR
jgi:hypothetical protein